MYIENLRKNFVDDYKLPIKLFDNENFKYLIDLYDPVYDCKKQYKVFLLNHRKNKKNKNDKVSEFSKIKQLIIDDISNNKSFKEFANDKLTNFIVEKRYPSRDAFNNELVNKIFISIDLVKANFNSINFYNKDILNSSNYEEFIKKYTESNSIIESKKLRQVIFGSLEPKKQVIIEKFIINEIVKALEKVGKYNIFSVTHDEILIETNENQDILEIEHLINKIISLKSFPFRVEKYKLLKIGSDTKLGFVKKNLIDNKIEFKSVDASYMPQAFKKFFNLELEDRDLHFKYDNQIAKFLKPLE